MVDTTTHAGMPPEKPADPQRRREPLPWQCPKATQDDPEALRRVQLIMEHASYRPADEDMAFLQDDETRGMRLQLDYFKAEDQMRQHGVEQTVVIFGSTRTWEPAAAHRQLQACKEAAAADPGDARLKAHVVKAERIKARSGYYEISRELGRLIASAGDGPGDNRVMVATGGGRQISIFLSTKASSTPKIGNCSGTPRQQNWPGRESSIGMMPMARHCSPAAAASATASHRRCGRETDRS